VAVERTDVHLCDALERTVQPVLARHEDAGLAAIQDRDVVRPRSPRTMRRLPSRKTSQLGHQRASRASRRGRYAALRPRVRGSKEESMGVPFANGYRACGEKTTTVVAARRPDAGAMQNLIRVPNVSAGRTRTGAGFGSVGK
jgi:hypothetical protein